MIGCESVTVSKPLLTGSNIFDLICKATKAGLEQHQRNDKEELRASYTLRCSMLDLMHQHFLRKTTNWKKKHQH